jgi:hypothetical protein
MFPRRRLDGRLEPPSHFKKRRFCGQGECAKITEQKAQAIAAKRCQRCDKPVKQHDRNKMMARKLCDVCARARTALGRRIEKWFHENPGEYMSAHDLAVKFNATLRYTRNVLAALNVAGLVKREIVWHAPERKKT